MAFIEEQEWLVNTEQKNIYEIYEEARKKGISLKPFDILSYTKTIDSIKLVDDFLDDDISGIIEKFMNYYQITLNKSHSNLRRRFTLAHELGHFFYIKNI